MGDKSGSLNLIFYGAALVLPLDPFPGLQRRAAGAGSYGFYAVILTKVKRHTLLELLFLLMYILRGMKYNELLLNLAQLSSADEANGNCRD